jgi:hypothetical protein
MNAGAAPPPAIGWSVMRLLSPMRFAASPKRLGLVENSNLEHLFLRGPTHLGNIG